MSDRRPGQIPDEPSGAIGGQSRTPSKSPIYRLRLGVENAPLGYEPEGAVGNTSGELNVSSGEEILAQGPYMGQEPVLRAKTIRDLQKLRKKGFEIDFDDTKHLGKGVYGTVYKGVYNDKISELSDKEGRRMDKAKSGQTFAAKYVQFLPNISPDMRLYHEIEKRIMKCLSHPNIVSIKIAINLGTRKVIRTPCGGQMVDINTFDRMFLAMECGICTLRDFGDDKRIDDRLAIEFAKQVAAGMNYMHEKGVIHGDAHKNNIMVFSGQSADQFVAKWIDFGRSVSRVHFGRWGIKIGDKEWEKIRQMDVKKLVETLKYLADIGPQNSRIPNTFDVQEIESLADELNTSTAPLVDVLQNYHFDLIPLPGGHPDVIDWDASDSDEEDSSDSDSD